MNTNPVVRTRWQEGYYRVLWRLPGEGGWMPAPPAWRVVRVWRRCWWNIWMFSLEDDIPCGSRQRKYNIAFLELLPPSHIVFLGTELPTAADLQGYAYGIPF